MELPQFTLPLIQGFIICLARVGSMVSSIPVFSGGQIPPQMRIGIAVLFSLLIYPAIAGYLPEQSFGVFELALLILQEVMLGLMVGFLGQLVFMAAEFAGSVIGIQMGFAAANVFDPTTQRQVALVSQFQGILAILLFLALDAHHLFFKAIVASFQILTPGSLSLFGGAIPMLMDVANHSLILSIRLVAPVIALLVLSNLALGLMARIFPQMNVFLISFPIKIGLALIVMGMTLQFFASILSQEFSLLADRFLHLFNLL